MKRDKLIETKAQTTSNYVFIVGFILAMGSLAIDLPPTIMFIILLLSGIVSEMVSEISQFLLLSERVLMWAKPLISNSIRKLRFNHNEMTQQVLADKSVCDTPDNHCYRKCQNIHPSLELAFRIVACLQRPIARSLHF
jgi:hypothetical protein